MNKLIIGLLAAALLAVHAPAADAAQPSPASGPPSASLAANPSLPPKPVKGEDVVATAKKYQGVPYKYGGTSPKGFDCSGFVMFVFNEHGKQLPRTADKQFETGTVVQVKNLKPGDLVFFTTTEKGASHCGIFVGYGKFIHASSSHGVMISALGDMYWRPRYLGARRVL